jgi:exopolysaccharide biosynthesis polyprenyl glycosylphosphotransferase
LVIPVFGLALVFGGIAAGLYERKSFERGATAFLRAVVAVFFAWAGLLALCYVFFFAPVGRWVVGISSLTALAGLLAPRLLVLASARRARRRVLLLDGAGTLAAVRPLLAGDANSFELVDGPPVLLAEGTGPSSPQTPTLPELCRRVRADVVVVPAGDGARCLHSADDVMQCLSCGVEVVDVSGFVERHFHKVPAKEIDVAWLLSAHVHICRPTSRVLKRAFDVAAGLVGLAVTLPFWPVVALLIKLSSLGPVFYRQARVGFQGRPFTIYKFRTMVHNAEVRGQALWAAPGDPRVTYIGRLLRKTRIDEIPQFWNILRGDMSLIGPRPERPEFVQDLARRMSCYHWRHLVRPGATGWAQINFRYGATEEDAWEKLSYDLYYVKHFSVGLDAYIFLRTLGALVHGSR